VIAERLGIVSSSMSFHLAALANAGLVSQRRQSRLIIYAANYPEMNALMGFLTENCCNGVSCTDVAVCCPSSEQTAAATMTEYAR
jgi:DNA-binding transcriptional ArsR family regulator